jgi:hypothetical protein
VAVANHARFDAQEGHFDGGSHLNNPLEHEFEADAGNIILSSRSNSAPPFHVEGIIPRKSCLKKPQIREGIRRKNARVRARRNISVDKLLCNMSHLAGSLCSNNSNASRISYVRSSTEWTEASPPSASNHRLKRGSHKSAGSGETAAEAVSVRFDSVSICEYSYSHLANAVDITSEIQEEKGDSDKGPEGLVIGEPTRLSSLFSCTVDDFESQRKLSKRVKDTKWTIAQRRFLLYRQGFTEEEIEGIISKQRVAQKRRKELLEHINTREARGRGRPKGMKHLWEKILSPLSPILPNSVLEQHVRSAKAGKRTSII